MIDKKHCLRSYSYNFSFQFSVKKVHQYKLSIRKVHDRSTKILQIIKIYLLAGILFLVIICLLKGKALNLFQVIIILLGTDPSRSCHGRMWTHRRSCHRWRSCRCWPPAPLSPGPHTGCAPSRTWHKQHTDYILDVLQVGPDTNTTQNTSWALNWCWC